MKSPEPAPTSKAQPRFQSLTAMRAGQAHLGRRGAPSAERRNAALSHIEEFIGKGVATGVLLADESERWAAQSLLDYWAAVLEREGRPCADATLAPFVPELAPVLPESACPYVGLQAFDERQSQLYFGRESEIEALRALLERCPLVAIVGPSGSGKSSLARAGLARAIGGLEKNGGGSARWHVLRAVLPGTDPLSALEQALLESPPTVGCVLLVDQFEELFTLCSDPAMRTAFIERLLAFIGNQADGNRVIVTIRSDFEEYVTKHARLYELYQAGRLQLLPLGPAQLRAVIEAPAAAVNLKFERGVVDALMQDLLGEPAGLPLLQTSLQQLWLHRSYNIVTMEQYRAIGGGRRALARWADETFEALMPEDQVTARRIFVRLGLPIDDRFEVTRTRITRAELHHIGEASERVDRVLARLVSARLVRQTSGATRDADRVEVVHEALVRNWPRLADWLADARQHLRVLRHLQVRAEEWRLLGEKTGGLLDPIQLQEAERWVQSDAALEYGTGDAVLRFLAASRKEADAAHRRRTAALFAFCASLVVMACLATYAAYVNKQAADAARRAKESLQVSNAELMARTRELATAMKEKDAKAAVLRIRSENIKRSGQALNALAELTEDEAALLAPSPEVTFTATKARRGPDSHGKTLYVFTITPHGLEHHEVTGVFYVLFGKVRRERIGGAPRFEAQFQLNGCLPTGAVVIGFADRAPITARIDVCDLTGS